MTRRRVKVVNKLGLHARAAAKLVKLAAAYESAVTLRRGEQSADATSIMSVMMLAAPQGSVLTLTANGADASCAADAICALFADCFGEGE